MVEAIKHDCDHELTNVQPLFEESMKAVNSISLAEVIEVTKNCLTPKIHITR